MGPLISPLIGPLLGPLLGPPTGPLMGPLAGHPTGPPIGPVVGGAFKSGCKAVTGHGKSGTVTRPGDYKILGGPWARTEAVWTESGVGGLTLLRETAYETFWLKSSDPVTCLLFPQPGSRPPQNTTQCVNVDVPTTLPLWSYAGLHCSSAAVGGCHKGSVSVSVSVLWCGVSWGA